MKKYIAILGLAAAVSLAGAQAQVQINSFSFNYTDNFNTYAGTAAPANWSFFGTDSGVFIGTDNGTSTAAGIRALGLPGDYSLGFNMNSSSTIARISFQNNTGFAITDMTLSFQYELWRQTADGRASSMTFANVTSTGFTNIGFNNFTVGGNAVTTTTAGGYTSIVGTAVSGSMSEFATYTRTLSGLNIANGATFGFDFTYNRGTPSPNFDRQSIGIDNFSLSTTAIPEPSSLALVALVGVTVLFRRYRVRRNG